MTVRAHEANRLQFWRAKRRQQLVEVDAETDTEHVVYYGLELGIKFEDGPPGGPGPVPTLDNTSAVPVRCGLDESRILAHLSVSGAPDSGQAEAQRGARSCRQQGTHS